MIVLFIQKVYKAGCSRAPVQRLRLLVNLTEVLLGGVDGWLDGLRASLPVGRANLTVLLGELESLNQSQGLVHGSTDRQVVDGDLSQGSLRVNQEDTSQGNTLLLDQDTVVLGQGVVGVSNQWNVDWAQATVLSGDVGPGQQGVLGVGGGKQNLDVLLSELLDGIGVGNDLSWANESESQWDEGQQDPLTLVLLQGDLLENTVDDGGLLESWGWLLDDWRHCDYFLFVCFLVI